MQYPLSTALLFTSLQSWALAQSTFSCLLESEPIAVCCAGFVASFPTSSLTTGLDCAKATENSVGDWECPAYQNGGVPEGSCCVSVGPLLAYLGVRDKLTTHSLLSSRKTLRPPMRMVVTILKTLKSRTRPFMKGSIESRGAGEVMGE